MTPPAARLVARLAYAAALVVVSTTAVSIAPASPEAPASTTKAPNALRKAAPAPAAPETRVLRGTPGPYSYRWPVKPFGAQHPVRGFFGDPRISNGGRGRQFHFGVDISAANGTPVYATLSGTAYINSRHSTTVEVVGTDGVEFSYWHVLPTIRSGQRVVAYETVIGRIEEPYGHVHFSEKRAGRYLNPLRPGALGPFVDDTTPRVHAVYVSGGALVAEVYDETPLSIPRPWHDLPVMPAVVRFRVLDARGSSVIGWRTAADFRLTIPSASAFDDTWAPGTTQNHVRAPGRYRLVLARLGNLDSDGLVVELTATDTRSNRTRARLAIGDGESRSLTSARPTTAVPILMYHVIADPPAGAPYPELYVSRSNFAAQMRWLARRGYQAVTQRDVWNHWHRGGALPPKPVVISFDDGYRGVAEAALPELQRRSWPGVLNLTVKNLRVAGGLTESQVRRLLGAGWELASHSLTHPDLTSLGEPALAREVSRSRAILRARFGVPVDFFCYPAGRHDARVIRAVRRAGYLGATTTVEGLARPAEPYELRRVRVNGSDDAEELGARLRV